MPHDARRPTGTRYPLALPAHFDLREAGGHVSPFHRSVCRSRSSIRSHSHNHEAASDIDGTSGNHLHITWSLRRQLDRKDLELAAGRLGPRMYRPLRDNDQVARVNLTLFVT